jgi:Flp pilus assembly pilin Flp
MEVIEMLLTRRQGAQALVEFGFLLALVAVVSIAGLLLFGATVSQLMSSVSRTVALNV